MRFYAAGGLSAPQFQCTRGHVCKKVRELPVEQSSSRALAGDPVFQRRQ
jgi:hypothetical protein